MTKTAKRLYSALTTRPQTRGELAQIVGVRARTIRRAVEELRNNGYNVASNSDTGGYWLGNEADRWRTIKEYRSRAFKELDTAAALAMGPIEGQEAIEL